MALLREIIGFILECKTILRAACFQGLLNNTGICSTEFSSESASLNLELLQSFRNNPNRIRTTCIGQLAAITVTNISTFKIITHIIFTATANINLITEGYDAWLQSNCSRNTAHRQVFHVIITLNTNGIGCVFIYQGSFGNNTDFADLKRFTGQFEIQLCG